jgi:hypothetical protein
MMVDAKVEGFAGETLILMDADLSTDPYQQQYRHLKTWLHVALGQRKSAQTLTCIILSLRRCMTVHNNRAIASLW